MRKEQKISDYHPMKEDIRQISFRKEYNGIDPETLIADTAADREELFHDLEELLDSIENRRLPNMDKLLKFGKAAGLTDVQILILYLKNAFEGESYFNFGILTPSLIKSGSFLIDWDNQKNVDLSLEFINNKLRNYNDVLTTWKEIVNDDPKKVELLPKIINYILFNQLIKLPVAMLDLNAEFFYSVNDKFFSSYREISLKARAMVAEDMLVSIVNDKYKKRFRMLLRKIMTKENILYTLSVKLSLIEDPTKNIQTEADLENAYLEHLLKSKPDNADQISKRLQVTDNNSELNGTLEAQIKKLYRAISKNCKETFTKTEVEEDNEVMIAKLNSFFFESGEYYNSYSKDIGEQLVVYEKLKLLLISLVNYRVVNGMEVSLNLNDMVFGYEKKAGDSYTVFR